MMSWLPSWVWTVSPLWWLGIALGFAMLLILVGLWGRRVGRELRCRKCGYEIAELPSAKCPECGLADVTRRPKRGVYRARPMFVLVGGVLLIVCATPVGWMLSKANWRTLVPAVVLIAAVDFGDEAAATELTARAVAGSLDEKSVRRVVAGALVGQKEAPLRSARLKNWLQILAGFDAQTLLTDDEWERMVLQSIREVDAVVRARTREGDDVPLLLRVERAVPHGTDLSSRVWVTGIGPFAPRGESITIPIYGDLDDRINERNLRQKHGLQAGDAMAEIRIEFGCAAIPRMGSMSRALWPSERMAIAAARQPASVPAMQFPVNGTAGMLPPGAPPAMTGSTQSAVRTPPEFVRQVRVPIQVFAAGSDEDCEPLSGPDVRRQVENLLQFGHARVQFGDRDRRVIHEWQEPTVRMIEPTAIPLAFEAFLVQGERRVRWGTIDAAAEDALLNRTLPADAFEQMKTPGELFLELVPTREFARNSLDLRYVNETFRFGPLPYTPRPEVGSGGAGRLSPGR